MSPCLNQGICFDNYGSYTCQCQSGFGGTNCENVMVENDFFITYYSHENFLGSQ